MKGDIIRYRAGYKYVLEEDYAVQLAYVRPDREIITEYLTLSSSGRLFIRHGYAWDGPSGPTIDTRTSMRGSLVHDALYQLIRDGLLNIDQRVLSDIELHDICVEDGMHPWRAHIWLDSVGAMGASSACGDGGRPVRTAP